MSRRIVVTGLALLALSVGCTDAVAASRWSIQRPTTPKSFNDGSLYDVSCVSTKTCVTVGRYDNKAGDELPLVEHWNGSKWLVQSVPIPRKSSEVTLDGVSCSSTKACVAVGSFVNSVDDEFPLVERWNGSKWSIQPVPRTTGALVSVSCPSRTGCTAVGQDGDENPLVERWNGSRWLTQSTPKATNQGSGGGLNGVSCSTSGSCVAVGSLDEQDTGCLIPLVERWNGRVWAIQTSPRFGACNTSDNGLNAVWCGSQSACIAVGADDQSVPVLGFPSPQAEKGNATVWNLEPTPSVTYLVDPWGGGGAFNGLSCRSRGYCLAVGWAGSDAQARPLIERWNGHRWMIESTPARPHDGALRGASCSSPTACVVVGDDQGAQTEVPLIESTIRPSRPPAAPLRTGGLG